MAPKAPPVERIRLEDILLPIPVASTSTRTPQPPRRRSQVARKSTGGMPPRQMVSKESSPMSASSRKSRPTISPSPTAEAFLEPLNMPIRNSSQSARKSRAGMPLDRRPTDAAGTPDSDGTENSRAGSSDPSSSMSRGRRTTQTARKSTGGVAPRSQLDESTENTPSPRILPQPIIPPQNTGPGMSCGLCPVPLQTPYAIPNPSQPIHHFCTICQHNFHHLCYMNYITTAPPNARACCPQCQANLLTGDRYWVHVTTNSGNQCYTDLTKDVEDRLLAVRLARQQIFIDMIAYRNFQVAISLLTGPEAVDVNGRTPIGGFNPLHFFAINNDVLGIDFLLSHGADRDNKNDADLSPIECARSSGAWDAVTRLT
ncbi:hypothetical protein FB451DRAFT_1290863 [Mycena latifolia]|nr:hypothetical protein FB451DRAFT_1290863 [Mycena latifolia]